ncbi:ParB N-terminal domain-containing protein [Streptomyces arenae]|nr:ParB N-terminal domain-containing protein [Streptomyces arenae]
MTSGEVDRYRAALLEKYPITKVSIRSLLPADSPRLDGERADHIQLLVESDAHFPPIVAHRPTMRVIDGMHRLRAAALRGDDTIDVQFFDGAEEDAFVIAVRMNVRHGLPLSLDDRKAAARRMVGDHPDWSDRSIAAVAGLSARTVRAIRGELAGAVEGELARTGRDGRARPLSSATRRELAARLLLENPDASLREIARAAGLAPSTVMDVRDRLRRGQDPVPSSQRRPRAGAGGLPEGEASRPAGVRAEAAECLVSSSAALRRLRKDPSLRFSNVGRTLLGWLSNRPEREQWKEIVSGIPAHSVESVLQVAEANVRAWQEFAEQLKGELGEHRAESGR